MHELRTHRKRVMLEVEFRVQFDRNGEIIGIKRKCDIPAPCANCTYEPWCDRAQAQLRDFNLRTMHILENIDGHCDNCVLTKACKQIVKRDRRMCKKLGGIYSDYEQLDCPVGHKVV